MSLGDFRNFDSYANVPVISFCLTNEREADLLKSMFHKKTYSSIYYSFLNFDITGDLKESFYIGPIGESDLQNDLNQWPSEGTYLLCHLLTTNKYSVCHLALYP